MKLLLLLPIMIIFTPHSTRHTLLIPIVHYDYAMPRNDRGIAWQDNNRPFLANRLGAEYWYNASSYKHVANGRALPIIRPHTMTAIIDEFDPAYDGYLLVMNEPDQAGQDNLTPYEAIDFVHEIRRALPHAQLVGPNILGDSFDWLQAYYDNGGYRFDVLSIHVYSGMTCSPISCIDKMCNNVPCRVWVTEFNHLDTAVFGEWLQEMDSRVERIFAYTAVNGCCNGRFDLIQDRELTQNGHIWRTQ